MGSEDSQTAAGAFLGAIHRLGNAALPRNPSLTPTCLICLEVLTTEEFEVGETLLVIPELRLEYSHLQAANGLNTQIQASASIRTA